MNGYTGHPARENKMITSRETPELKAVQTEALNLLIVYRAYRQKLQFLPEAFHLTRDRLLTEHICLRIMENDLILRLYRLDEQDRTKECFSEALKSIRGVLQETDAREIDKRLKAYRALINPLKVEVRNHHIAHLAKGASESFDPRGGFDGKMRTPIETPISEVVNIVDLLSGREVPYTLRLGSQEIIIDLRVDLQGDGD